MIHWACRTGAAGVDGAPQARTDITVLRSDSAALLTTVTCRAGARGQKPRENLGKTMENLGKTMENLRKPAKTMENLGKTI